MKKMCKLAKLTLSFLLALSMLTGIVALAAAIGDLDGNGRVTSADARCALRIAARLDPLTPELLEAGDVDGNGKINSSDARMILRAAAKLSPLPGGEPTEEPTEEPTQQEPAAEPQYSVVQLRNIPTFFEGRAWAYSYDRSAFGDGKDRYYLIDDNGVAHYTVTASDLRYALNASGDINLGVLSDDVAYVSYGTGFVLIDRDGNEYCRCDDPETTLFGRYGDRFLVGKLTSTYSEKHFDLYLIDKTGAVVSDVLMSFDDRRIFTNMGFGIFGSKNLILNLATDRIFELDDNLSDLSFTSEEVLYRRYRITPSDLADENAFAAWKERCAEWNKLDAVRRTNDNVRFSEGLYVLQNAEEPGYYDEQMNLVVPAPEVPDTVRLVKLLPFCDGYAAVYLKGADGKDYVTVIDREGKMQYDPILRYGDASMTVEGYLYQTVDGKPMLIDVTGQQTDISTADLSGLSADVYAFYGVYSIYQGWKIHYVDDIASGIFAKNYTLRSFDGTKVIDGIKVPVA